MAMPYCDVCGGEAIGVAASPLGPISYAYCGRCLREGAEPFGSIAVTVWSCGGIDKMADWAKSYIEPTLRITGKTTEDLLAAVERMDKEYEAHMYGTDDNESD